MVNATFKVMLLSSISFWPDQRSPQNDTIILGAWESPTVRNGKEAKLFKIYTRTHFITSIYAGNEFFYANGGRWEMKDNAVVESFKFSTPDFRSADQTVPYQLVTESKNKITLSNSGYSWTWSRIDEGTSKLSGTWIPKDLDNSETVVRLFSNTKFLEVSYNASAKQFFGLEGGTYTAKNDKYIQSIEVTSKDSTQVGTKRIFNYKLKGNEWRQQGLSSISDSVTMVWVKQK